MSLTMTEIQRMVKKYGVTRSGSRSEVAWRLRTVVGHMMTLSDDGQPVDETIKLGDIEALQGVVKFPVRVKCATLGWNTLIDALDEATK